MNSLYWGEGGRFGPFDEQEDGWPNAGQVMRYREKSNLSAETFALLYSKELEKAGKQNKRGQVTATWILNMEKQNLIPLDMERRRIIARLLHIPPVLLGLATLEAVTIQSRKKKPMGTLQKVTIDLAKHQKSIRDALHIHRTSSAKNLMQDVERDIWTLKDIEAQVRGDLLYQIQELLLSNFLLATRIMKDQRNYPAAYRSANEAVRVARQMQDNDLIATALYTRGCIKAEWARRVTVFNGMFQLDTGKMKSAAKDFQGVLQLEQETSIHPQLAGFTKKRQKAPGFSQGDGWRRKPSEAGRPPSLDRRQSLC
uniref:Uncharacterized protein n=1 Tax=Thermosporothrix sp. COM3 TaxID=2490863 RepID=A0A455SG88_9CHLR|nr:hypothetical protein KTC_11190 [Thermosporothrix sp. COM3]